MIPEQAVEAAAKAVYEDTFGKSWADESEDYRNELRETQCRNLETSGTTHRRAWHDAVSEAYVEGALSLEQASVMWNKNPYRTPDAR